MNLGNLAQNSLFFLGMNPAYKQEFDSAQADVELKQQKLAQLKMQTMSLQNQQQVGQDISKMISDGQSQDNAVASNPVKMAQIYRGAAAKALSMGDFVSAKRMDDMAKESDSDGLEAQKLQQQKQQQSKEDAASAALNYADNPTLEGAKNLASKAVASGINITDIPPLGSPKFKLWAQGLNTYAMTTKDRVEQANKIREQYSTRQQQWQEHEDNVSLRQESMAQTAALRQENLLLRRESMAEKPRKIVSLPSGTYEEDRTGTIQGTRDLPDKGLVRIAGVKQGTAQQATTNAVVSSASEAIRGLRVISAMPPGQTSGAFSGLTQGTVLESLGKVAGNVVTPESMQLYNTGSQGLGLEMGRLLTLGGGRGVNEAQIKEFQDMVRVHPGDTELEAMYKFSNAADVVRNRMETLPEASDPKVLKQQREVENYLKKIPLPDEIIAMAGKKKQTRQLVTKYHTLHQVMDNIEQSAQTPAASPSSGWGAIQRN